MHLSCTNNISSKGFFCISYKWAENLADALTRMIFFRAKKTRAFYTSSWYRRPLYLSCKSQPRSTHFTNNILCIVTSAHLSALTPTLTVHPDEWVGWASGNLVATCSEVHWLSSGLSLPVLGKSNVWATYTEWTPQSTYTPAVTSMSH